MRRALQVNPGVVRAFVAGEIHMPLSEAIAEVVAGSLGGLLEGHFVAKYGKAATPQPAIPACPSCKAALSPTGLAKKRHQRCSGCKKVWVWRHKLGRLVRVPKEQLR